MKNTMFDMEKWLEENISDKEVFELDDILYDISLSLFDFRINNDLKQKDLAEKLGVTQTMISKLESGMYNPTIEQLFKISKKLDFKFSVEFKEKDCLDNITKKWQQPRKDTYKDTDNDNLRMVAS